MEFALKNQFVPTHVNRTRFPIDMKPEVSGEQESLLRKRGCIGHQTQAASLTLYTSHLLKNPFEQRQTSLVNRRARDMRQRRVAPHRRRSPRRWSLDRS